MDLPQGYHKNSSDISYICLSLLDSTIFTPTVKKKEIDAISSATWRPIQNFTGIQVMFLN